MIVKRLFWGEVMSLLLIASIAAFAVSEKSGQKIQQKPERDFKIVELEVPTEAITLKVIGKENEDFPRDFEVEVKNVSSQPIYYLLIAGVLPDTKPHLQGLPLGFDLIYGAKSLANGERPQTKDIPIKTGQAIRLSIPREAAEGLRKVLANENVPEMASRKIELYFQYLYFGDGSGFNGKGKTQSRLHRVSRKSGNQTMFFNSRKNGFVFLSEVVNAKFTTATQGENPYDCPCGRNSLLVNPVVCYGCDLCECIADSTQMTFRRGCRRWYTYQNEGARCDAVILKACAGSQGSPGC
jgi:hypothetical protein